METKKIPYMHKMTTVAMLILSVIFAVCQTLLIYFFYETDVFLYAHGTPLPDFFHIVLAVFVLMNVIVFSIFKTKSHPDSYAPTGAIASVFAALSAFAVISIGIYGIMTYLENKKNLMFVAQRGDSFMFWASLASVLAFAYFIVTAFVKDKSHLKAWLGMGCIAWHILYLLGVYFDLSTPLNCPIRLIHEFALVASMIFVAMEVRFLLGTPKKGLYIASCVVAFMLLLASSMSNIICTLSGRLTANSSMLCYIFELFMAGYVLFRLTAQLCHSEQQ